MHAVVDQVLAKPALMPAGTVRSLAAAAVAAVVHTDMVVAGHSPDDRYHMVVVGKAVHQLLDRSTTSHPN